MKLPPRWKELSPLFDELIELDRAARTRRLESLRGSDPELAEQLADMLGTAAQADEAQFLEHRAPLDAASPAGLRGTQVGASAFGLQKRVGEGLRCLPSDGTPPDHRTWRARQGRDRACSTVRGDRGERRS